jgi:oligopeptide/dipeptide ABC transporter ATP-binding protein
MSEAETIKSAGTYGGSPVILDIRNLSIDYPISIGTVQAVRDVNLTLADSEVLGIVGESGCGKSTMGLAIMDLVREPGKIVAGEMLYHGKDILKMGKSEVRGLRGKNIAMVFQNPLTSLNPLMRIQDHFVETIMFHKPEIKRNEALVMTGDLLEELGIDRKRMKEYPHQMSGGMRQRIMIALALILKPDIVICDEPTTSLDVIVEAGFVDLLNRLRKMYQLSIILITHNLGLVAEIADRIVVMYGGKVMEEGPARDIFHSPIHPYTAGLIDCVPNIDLEQAKLTTMDGNPPDLVTPPSGCRFRERCPKAMDVCKQKEPPVVSFGGGRRAACWLFPEESSWKN